MLDSREYEGKLREIITKAVVARGKKSFTKVYTLQPGARPDRVLGCWLANHEFEAKGFPNCVVVRGKYEINVWYACQGNSKTDVLKEMVTYSENIPFNEHSGRLGKDEEVHVVEKYEPRAVAVKIQGNDVFVEVQSAFFVEVTGETKVCVLAFPVDAANDDFDDKEKDLLDDEDEGQLDVVEFPEEGSTLDEEAEETL
ncbi:MAG: outer spore coat protein CotE [Clostridia bacterium]|nr:outer spore coat protein CotE [Clostridia bacterium]